MKTKESKTGAAKTKPAADTSSYETREIVLAKIRGFPAWPGMVVDPDTVPNSVSKERPTGKKVKFYCVRFFPAGDYAWIVPKDISKLQKHEIEAYINEPFRKNGDLLKGYKIALDPTSWEAEVQAKSDERAEAEAEAEVDELASDAEGEDDGDAPRVKAPKPKKRKRESEAVEKEKKPKTPKAPKPKKDADATSTKKKTPGGKGKAGKSKAVVESEDEGERGDDDGKPPATKKAKREAEEEENSALNDDPNAKLVKDWRHKLQKTFLTKTQKPTAEEMPAMDELFTTIEKYDGMTIDYLTYSKIGKVMRHIAKSTDDIPRDADFKFRERAQTLVDQWQQILNAHKSNGTTKTSRGGGGESASPVANGTSAAAGGAKTDDATVAMDVDDAAKSADADAEGEKVNGAGDAEDAKADADGDADAPADADTSVLADVTMSEAA